MLIKLKWESVRTFDDYRKMFSRTTERKKASFLSSGITVQESHAVAMHPTIINISKNILRQAQDDIFIV